MNIRSRLLLGAVAMGVAATTGHGAQAQDGIEIVTVTAAKREQNVQDVPISMNVLSGKTLEAFGISDIKDISGQVPGLIINKGQTTHALYMRGFGTNAGQNPAFDQTVSLYVDGVYSGRAREYMAPFYDVQRFEVLRGPQGTLLGKNTSVGALSVITNSPTDEFEMGASVGYVIDRSKGVDAEAYISGPVTDTLNARLAVKIIDTSGWMQNVANGKNDPQNAVQSGRLTLVFDPDENFHMVTKYQFDHTSQDGRSTTGFPTTVLRSQIPGYTQDNPGIPGELTDLDRNNAHHFSNLIEYDLGNLTLVSQSGFTAFTSRSNALGRHLPVETVWTDYTDSFRQFMQEFRVQSPADQTVEWMAGIYYDNSSYNVANVFRYAGFPTAAFNGATRFVQKSDWYTVSGYATATWHITDQLHLLGGVRGTFIERDGNFDRVTLPAGSIFPTVGASAFPASGPLTIPNVNKTESSFDPSVTLKYDVTPDINVYASWAKGSKGGAFQASRSTTAATFYLKPETSTSWEIGAKTQLWDFLTFNVSGFWMTFKSLQVSAYVIIPGSPIATLTAANAAEAESKGVELVLNADLNQWIPGLSFASSASYTLARFTDYPNSPCTFAATAAGCVVTAAGTGFNGAGLPVNPTPDWSGTLALNYTRDLNDWLNFHGDVGADFQSHVWNDGGLFDARYGLQSSFTKINFRAGIGAPDGAWEVNLIGRNIFDVLTVATKYNFISVNVFTIEEGRRLMLQGKVKLN